MLLKNTFNLVMLLLLFNSCSHKNKFNLEKHTTIKFEEASYQDWVSGIKGGGSGVNIHLVLSDELSKEIQLKGVFFKEEFSPLKFQKLNYYQGFIKGKGNWDKDEDKLENNKMIDPENTVKEKATSFPFNLEIDEAVISYIEKDEIKYFKIKLSKKDVSEMPM